MLENALDIIGFIEHPQLLNDRSLSAWQRTILKSIYGLELSEQELEIYKSGTGRETYSGIEQEEATIISGRRGGKTSKIACPTVLYEAFRSPDLPPGETGYVHLSRPGSCKLSLSGTVCQFPTMPRCRCVSRLCK